MMMNSTAAFVALVILGLMSKIVKSQEDFTLKILFINDHHSHLPEETFPVYTADLDSTITANINTTNVTRVYVTYGGFPRLVTLFDQLESASTADAILKLHAGDVFSGTLFFSLFTGYADMQLMSPMCFHALGIGNHEFDLGNAPLEEFLVNLTESTTNLCESPTKILAANIVPPSNTTLESLLLPYMIQEYENGQKVAIIGLTTNLTKSMSSPDAGTVFDDEVTVLTETVAALEAEGINKIIAMTHTGYDYDTAAISTVAGVDVIVGSHSHSLLGTQEELGPLGFAKGSFPSMSNGVCIVQAWSNGHGIGELDIAFDADGVVESCTGSLKVPYDNTAYAPAEVLDETFTNGLTDYLSGLSTMVATEPDEDTAAVLATFEVAVKEFGDVVIANVPTEICHDGYFFTGATPPGCGRNAETVGQGSGVCNLVAKAFLDQTPSSDVSIANIGSCRSGIDSGDFTVGHAITLLPFSNTLVEIQMTGADIIEVLNSAAKNAMSKTSPGAFPYASGLRFDIDGNLEAPVHNVQVNPRLESEWSAIDETETYTVLAGSFIASGKDGYIRMGEITDKIDLFKVDSETFITYAQEKGTLADLPSDEYATQTFIAAIPIEALITETSDPSEGEAEVETTDATKDSEETAGEATGVENSTPLSSSNSVSSMMLSLVNLVILSSFFVGRF